MRAGFVIFHPSVLLSNILKGNFYGERKVLNRRVCIQKFGVGNNANIPIGPPNLAWVAAARAPFNTRNGDKFVRFHILLFFGQSRGIYLKPNDILTGLQLVDSPVGSPGIEKHRLAALVAGVDICHQQRILTLDVLNRIFQAVGFKLVIDHFGAAPTFWAAHEVSFAVAIAVKEGSNIWVSKMGNTGNVFGIRSCLVHQVALKCASFDLIAHGFNLALHFRVFQIDVVDRKPTVCPHIHIAPRTGEVESIVGKRVDHLNFIA